MKVTAIEEAQDIKNMKLEEVIGSHQTFEMTISDHIEERKKGVALLSNNSVDQTEGNLETNEESSEAIVLIERLFNNILKKINGMRGTDVRNTPSNINSGSPRERIDYKNSQGKGAQCHAYEGFGHVRFECPNHFKNQKKGLSITWSADDLAEPKHENSNQVKALT
jgi:hypothetical protein